VHIGHIFIRATCQALLIYDIVYKDIFKIWYTKPEAVTNYMRYRMLS
jgi:hypothetical protein